MNPASIDPSEWLASHDIKAWLDAGRDDDPLAAGRDELLRADGNLSLALEACPDCRAEIVLAWLAGQPPDALADGVIVAAWAVERVNAG